MKSLHFSDSKTTPSSCHPKYASKITQNQHSFKALGRVKPGFKSVPLQFYFEISRLASAEKWQEIQNMAGEERF